MTSQLQLLKRILTIGEMTEAEDDSFNYSAMEIESSFAMLSHITTLFQEIEAKQNQVSKSTKLSSSADKLSKIFDIYNSASKFHRLNNHFNKISEKSTILQHVSKPEGIQIDYSQQKNVHELLHNLKFLLNECVIHQSNIGWMEQIHACLASLNESLEMTQNLLLPNKEFLKNIHQLRENLNKRKKN